MPANTTRQMSARYVGSCVQTANTAGDRHGSPARRPVICRPSMSPHETLSRHVGPTFVGSCWLVTGSDIVGRQGGSTAVKGHRVNERIFIYCYLLIFVISCFLFFRYSMSAVATNSFSSCVSAFIIIVIII